MVLPADSYTARRLEHATPLHLHLTTRRAFIGPIPEGWLHSHRKEWYRQYLSRDKQRAPTFTAAHPIVSGPQAAEEITPRPSSQSADTQLPVGVNGAVSSTTSLLHDQRRNENARVADTSSERRQSDGTVVRDGQARGHISASSRMRGGGTEAALNEFRDGSPRLRFSNVTRLQLRNRAQRMIAKGSARSSKIKPGELMKVDKMLVRIDVTQQSIKEGFDERISQGVETKPIDKWREFMVVCRKHAEGALLQLYKTRVITITADKTKKRPQSEIVLQRGAANVNMFSSLDKTLCMWNTERGKTYIYYLRPQSGAASVEWYTFLRGVLGHDRTRSLQVNVPDLSVSLRLDDPFKALESSQLLQDAVQGDDDALAKAVSDEQGAAGAIVARCIDMLMQSPEWAEILRHWADKDRIGLAWKRYDRLEWVHGTVEQRMYGTMAMQRTHDLELRPKDHYPCEVKIVKDESMEEPRSVEGFLIRLTSQKGQSRGRMGNLMYKRLYFTSQNHYLVFTRPARAVPPPPPRLPSKRNGNVPSTEQIQKAAPLIYDIDPYPLEGDRIAWLNDGETTSASDQIARDEEAEGEAGRNLNMLLTCDGFIDLCDVQRVRGLKKGATPADEHLDEGSDVDFHDTSGEHRGEDGRATELEEDRVFELVMKNGLVIRLQAYNIQAKTEWMKRLRPLVKYWKMRADEDMDLFKAVRQQNLDLLQIDARAEAQVGSFAYKWEVSQSCASPLLYNMCGISKCRPIHLSGSLFRKSRRHGTFTRCHIILSNGHLLIFQDTLRKQSGKKLVHSHLERLGSVDLKGCYLYSGLLTENDLLYQNQTFDSNMPGHHALPRIYLEDAWTSADEDAMTTFVIWHAKSKSWFRSSQSVDDVRLSERANSINSRGETDDGRTGRTKTKLTRVSQLGVTGRSVVFKARSRAERDHWVLAIQVEIERLAAQNEEVRLVEDEDKT